MNFGWRKASQRPPRYFQNPLKMLAIHFKEFILKLNKHALLLCVLHLTLPHYHFIHGCQKDEMLNALLG